MWYNAVMAEHYKNPNYPAGIADTAGDSLEHTRATSAKDLLRAAGMQSTLEIEGEQFDALEVESKLTEAFALVRAKIGQYVEIRPDDIIFQKLEGILIGGSTKEKVMIDPAVFRHPVTVITEAVAHELLHKNTRIPNEGLVQAAVEQVFTGHGVEHTYDAMVKDFEEFVRRCGTSVWEIYTRYDAGDFDGIFSLYNEAYCGKLQGAERAKAFQFFQRVFPELRYNGYLPGYFDMITLKNPEEEVAAGVAAEAGAAA